MKVRKSIYIMLAILLILLTGCSGFGIGGSETQYKQKVAVGEEAFKEKRYEEAIDAYEEAQEINPEGVQSYEGLCQIYNETEDYSSAETVLKTGVDNVTSTEGKAELYIDLIDVSEKMDKSDVAIQFIKDEAFNATGKRDFGKKYEEAVVDYLRRIGLFSNTAAIVPAFDSISDVDPNWVFSAFSWSRGEVDTNLSNNQYSSGIPLCTLEDIRKNAKQYFNANIELADDYSYEAYLGDTFNHYDSASEVVWVGAKGDMTYRNNDFIVTDFYKKDSEYHIEGVFLALCSQDYTSFDQATTTCNVYIDQTGDENPNNSIGTATISDIHTNNGTRQDDAISYNFDIKSLDTDVYHYVLSDNPDGVAVSNTVDKSRAKGPFYLLSRIKGDRLTKTSQTSTEPTTKSKTSSSIVQVSESEVTGTLAGRDFGAEASSVREPMGDNYYSATNVLKRNMDTTDAAWVEGADGDGIGESISFDYWLGAPFNLKYFCMNNGYIKSDRTFQENGRIKQMEMAVNGEVIGTLTLEDSKETQFFMLPQAVPITTNDVIKLTIMSVYSGTDTASKDTALSYVGFYYN